MLGPGSTRLMLIHSHVGVDPSIFLQAPARRVPELARKADSNAKVRTGQCLPEYCNRGRQMQRMIEWAEQGRVPDPLVRAGIRRLLAERLRAND